MSESMMTTSKRSRSNDDELNAADDGSADSPGGGGGGLGDEAEYYTSGNNDDGQSSEAGSGGGGRQAWGSGGGGGGGGGRKDHPPSKVVHIRNLTESVTEADVKSDLARFGHINKTLFMYKKRQALVEYEDLQSAVRCVSDAAKFAVRIGGAPAYINFSPYNNLTKHEDAVQPFESSGGGVGGGGGGGGGRNEDNPVLFFSVHDAQYPINVDVLYAICSPFGSVLRIVIFRKNGVQAMIEFESPESAKHAKEELDDADIYSGCCTLQVEHAKIRSLNVPRNDQDSWDYTLPDQDPENGSSYSTRSSRDYENGGGGSSKDSIPSLMSSSAQPLGNPPTTTILMINNLCASKFNCDRLFNLLCLYGNVERIKFLLTKEGSAIVQMSNSDPVMNCLAHLNNTYVFGRKLQINVNNQCIFKPVAKPAPLADGTPSYRDYTNSKANRYTTPDAAKRNNPVPPSNVLHWFNAPPGYEQDQILDLFKDSGSKLPVKIKVFLKKSNSEKAITGLAEWNNIGDCTEALILSNNIEIHHHSSKYPYIFKLCYSSTPIVDPP